MTPNQDPGSFNDVRRSSRLWRTETSDLDELQASVVDKRHGITPYAFLIELAVGKGFPTYWSGAIDCLVAM